MISFREESWLSSPTGWPAAPTDGPAVRAASSPCWASVFLWPCWPCWCWAQCPRSCWKWSLVQKAGRPSRCTWWVVLPHRDVKVEKVDTIVQPHQVFMVHRLHWWKFWTHFLEHSNYTPAVYCSSSPCCCSSWRASLSGMVHQQVGNSLNSLPSPHFHKALLSVSRFTRP